MAWRERIAIKYRSQLGEDLSWDEESEFSQSEDLPSGVNMLFGYVAAVLDRQGSEDAAHILRHEAKPPRDQLDSVFTAAEQRGSAGSFPHLLVGADYWLPYRRQAIIEEPNWRGKVQRFGSTKWLSAEIEEIRAFIAAADPRATGWTTLGDEEPPDVLSAAWLASETISRLCAVALSRRLPLWYAG